MTRVRRLNCIVVCTTLRAVLCPGVLASSVSEEASDIAQLGKHRLARVLTIMSETSEEEPYLDLHASAEDDLAGAQGPDSPFQVPCSFESLPAGLATGLFGWVIGAGVSSRCAIKHSDGLC